MRTKEKAKASPTGKGTGTGTCYICGAESHDQAQCPAVIVCQRRDDAAGGTPCRPTHGTGKGADADKGKGKGNTDTQVHTTGNEKSVPTSARSVPKNRRRGKALNRDRYHLER